MTLVSLKPNVKVEHITVGDHLNKTCLFALFHEYSLISEKSWDVSKRYIAMCMCAVKLRAGEFPDKVIRI